MSDRANRPHSSRAMEEALQKMEAFWAGYFERARRLPKHARKGMLIVAANPVASIGPDWSDTRPCDTEAPE